MYGRWTLRLLANKAMELALVDSISHETLSQTLLCTLSVSGKHDTGVIANIFNRFALSQQPTKNQL